jgi:choice-of-anchor C domain-containing protein
MDPVHIGPVIDDVSVVMTAPPNLIQNGSFEEYAKDPSTWGFPGVVDFDVDIGNTDIAYWTVIVGKIDYFGACHQVPQKVWTAADGDHSLELAASPSAGGVSQTFATVAGAAYRVEFYMSGSPMTGWSGEEQPNKTLRVQAAGQSADFSYDVAAEQNSLEDMKWKLCTLTFVAESDSTTLEIFSTMDPVHIGPVIDGVSVVMTAFPCEYVLAGDLNDDCKVDFQDLAVMVANWQVDCLLDPTDPACIPK